MEGQLFTVGHSNHPTGHFLAVLQRHQVDVVADVRSRPYSRFVPQYNKRALDGILAAEGIAYLFLGAQLGGKPPRGDDVAAARLDYATRVLQPDFREGIEALRSAMAERRVCLLCRERDPLDCHRLHLICRYLTPEGVDIHHILPDGQIEPQRETERRLLARGAGRQLGLFNEAEGAALERAYDSWWRA